MERTTPDEPLHKCSECGFLGLRNVFDQIIEANIWFRQTGHDRNFSGQNIEGGPLCSMQQRQFEYRQPLPGGDPTDVRQRMSAQEADILNEIREDFVCSVFASHRRGFSPKEHREMVDRERQQSWQARREDDDRQWREKQAEAEHAWRKEDRRGELIWRIVQVVVFGVMGASVAILAAFIQRN
jgi:hypothetical protein